MPFKNKADELAYERKIYKIKRKEIRAKQNKWRKETAADQRYYQANQARILENKKRYYQENKAAIAERKRARYLRDKEKRLKKFLTQKKYERAHPGRAKKYYEAHKMEMITKRRQWDKDNPERAVAARMRQSRARKKARAKQKSNLTLLKYGNSRNGLDQSKV